MSLSAVPPAPDPAAIAAGAAWSPESWRGKTALQMPTYPDPLALDASLHELKRLPPLVTSWEILALKKQIADLGVPEVPDFLEQIVASGGHLWGCRMSADMNKVDMDDLYEGVEDIINATDFICTQMSCPRATPRSAAARRVSWASTLA